jgi:zinc and cadmium transporter
MLQVMSQFSSRVLLWGCLIFGGAVGFAAASDSAAADSAAGPTVFSKWVQSEAAGGQGRAQELFAASGGTVQSGGPDNWLLVGYCGAIILASLVGGWLPSVWQFTHTATQTLTSFVGGLMLGIAVFHLFPHSLHAGQSADRAAWWLMAGILSMFLLIRCFHFHHHGPLEISTEREDPCADHAPLLPLSPAPMPARRCDHDHSHHHDHDHDHDHQSAPAASIPVGATLQSANPAVLAPAAVPHCHHAHQLSWMGITIGLSLHTLLDGMALAASLHAESGHRVYLSLYGFGTFLAILLHKPLDAISITSLMRAGGWGRQARFRVNLGFSLMCPLGAVLFSLGLSAPGPQQRMLIDAALAYSAGMFLCISLSDLLPEMEFHSHNRLQLTVALLAGILLAYGIRFLEPSWMH